MSFGRKADTVLDKGTNFLLIIGIDKYLNHTHLKNAVKDAEKIKEVFLRKYKFEEDNTYVLYNEEATRSNILYKFQTLRHKISDRDSLLIWFSGHGILNEKGKGFWLPYDASKKYEGSFISNQDILDQIEQIDSLHTLLISDSCFSGSLFVSNRASVTERVRSNKSRWAITAGRKNEAVSDGLDNSPFASALIKYLDDHYDQPIMVNTLYENIKISVGHNHDQLPLGGPLYKVGDQGGEFVFELKEDYNFAWARALEENTIERYRIYVQNYPESPYATEATEKIKYLVEERNEWHDFIHSTVKRIENFIDNYSQGNYIRDAQEQQGILLDAIRVLNKDKEEEIKWQAATDNNTIEEYECFVEEFPDSDYVIEAKKRIRKLEQIKKDEELWLDTLHQLKHEKKLHRRQWGINYYLTVFPTGKFSDSARRMLEEIEEFIAAFQSEDIDKLTLFQNKYPNSGFNNKASKKIRYLEELDHFWKVVSTEDINNLSIFIDNCESQEVKSKAIQHRKNMCKPDEDAFKTAQIANTKQAYINYIAEYPKGLHLGTAKQRLRDIERADFEKVVDQDDWRELQDFLVDYPESNYKKQVIDKLEELDRKAFLEAKALNTIDSFEKYLVNNSKGIYINDALREIDLLKQRSNEVTVEVEPNKSNVDESLLPLEEVNYSDKSEIFTNEDDNFNITDDSDSDKNDTFDDQPEPKSLLEPEKLEHAITEDEPSFKDSVDDNTLKEYEVDQIQLKDNTQPTMLVKLEDEKEVLLLKDILKSADLELCQDYLNAFPNGKFVQEVKIRIQQIKNDKTRNKFIIALLVMMILFMLIIYLLKFE